MSEERTISPADFKRMKVLIVDDCADSAFLLSKLLESCGHDTRSALDVEPALEIAHQWRPEVVFLDLALPRQSGYVLATRLRNEGGIQDALLVALSGYNDDENRRAAAGIDAHLLKPASLQQLCDTISVWQHENLARTHEPRGLHL